MKKGLAISVLEKDQSAGIQVSMVSGTLKKGFCTTSIIDDTFLVGKENPEQLLLYINQLVLEAINPDTLSQKEVPLVVGVSSGGIIEKLFPEGLYHSCKIGKGSVQDVHLAEMWTFTLQEAILPQRIHIHPGGWEDEYEQVSSQEQLILPSDLRMLIAEIQGHVAAIHRKNSLQFLQRRAFQDGKDCAEKDLFLGQGQVRFRLLDDPRLSSDDAIRYTYLNAHPSLKKEFVKGIGSVFGWLPALFGAKKPPIISPQYTCIKTRNDPQAPKFSNIVMTFLADQCSRDGEGIPFGHIQETV